ncbi:MAG TPA: zinc ribbon domain-containing protein [Candidatus Competibacteraceae bacterium]|nr:zinc ribbon domain-containing protein [Candidatus Competibacteraceae bacterium]
MPIYEYRCESCQHEVEAIQKISDSPLTDCPSCGKPVLTKKISAAGFRLKGSGWYETDFKTGGQKKNLAKDDVPATESKSAESKADSKAKTAETTATTGSTKPAAAA